MFILYNNNYVWEGVGPNVNYIYLPFSQIFIENILGFLRQYSACITDNQLSKSVSRSCSPRLNTTSASNVFHSLFIADFMSFVFPIPDKEETMWHPDAACMANIFSNTLLGHCSISFRVST